MSYPNSEQQKVLGHLHGNLLVLASAGTGKTRLMADRLAAVIADGMPPEYHQAYDSSEEADWIAERLGEIQTIGDSARIGVLTRTHNRAAAIFEALESRPITLAIKPIISRARRPTNLSKRVAESAPHNLDWLQRLCSQHGAPLLP